MRLHERRPPRWGLYPPGKDVAHKSDPSFKKTIRRNSKNIETAPYHYTPPTCDTFLPSAATSSCQKDVSLDFLYPNAAKKIVSGSCLGYKMSQFCWSFEVTKHQKQRRLGLIFCKVLAAQVQIFDALLQRSEELFQLFIADFALQCLVGSQVHNNESWVPPKKNLSHTNFCLPTTQTASLSFLMYPNDVQLQSDVFPVLQVTVRNQLLGGAITARLFYLSHFYNGRCFTPVNPCQSFYTLGFV